MLRERLAGPLVSLSTELEGARQRESDALLECSYTRHNGSASIVSASGEIDLRNVHRLAEMLAQAIGDCRTVILDFAGVSLIDSTGLNVLIRLNDQCVRRKTNLAVVFASQSLWRIFSVLSLQNVFHIFPTVDAALVALSYPDGLERGEQPSISTPRAAATY